MRIYLDECVDWRLARLIAGHETWSARQMKWTGLKNGELLARASVEFEAFITVDGNLAFQQNLPALTLAVFVLKARSNRLADLSALVPDLLAALASPRRGVVSVIEGSN